MGCSSVAIAAPGTCQLSGMQSPGAEQQEAPRHMAIAQMRGGWGGTAKTNRLPGGNVRFVNGSNHANDFASDPDGVDPFNTGVN